MNRRAIAGWIVAAIASAGAILAQEPTRQDKPASKPASSQAAPSRMDPADPIKALAWQVGSWSVAMTYFGPTGQSFTIATESTIESILEGHFIRERIAVPWGPTLTIHLEGTRSFDRFRGVYRAVWFDDFMGLADIFEGPPTGPEFSVSNLKAGTSSILPPRPETFLRITTKPGPTRDQFALVWEASYDKGATWTKTADYAYTRKP